MGMCLGGRDMGMDIETRRKPIQMQNASSVEATLNVHDLGVVE